MTTTPLTDQQLADIDHRHHPAVDPAACGTCWRLAASGKAPEHPECARRATLLPAPDAPDYEALAELTDEQKAALPARFHTPVFEGSTIPNPWVCSVCWGDGWVTRWPCLPAVKRGAEVFTPEHQAERAREDVSALAVELGRVRAELATAREQTADRHRRWQSTVAEAQRHAARADGSEQREGALARQLIDRTEKLRQARTELANAQQRIDALALVRVWRNEDGNEFLFADEVRAATGVPAAPTPGDGWVICSPEWLTAGGDCYHAPRRPSADPDYSHEHPAAVSPSA